MISLFLIIKAFIFAFFGGIIFSIIGLIPGTDETATMAPITLVIVLLGVEPVVIFAWFIAISIAMHITHTIPTAMTALPGSTMAVPMIRNAKLGKMLGIPHIIMRKMAAGSLIGSLIALPIAVAFGFLLAPLGEFIKPYVPLIFTLGAIFIAYMSKAKWGAVLALIPFSFLIQGLQKIALDSLGRTLFISIFMGITVGPMLGDIFNTFIPKYKKVQKRSGKSEIYLAPDKEEIKSIFPNPFKILTKKQVKASAIASAISACTFTFSPLGMTVLIGEIVGGRTKELYDRITSSVAVQDAVTNATYIGELIIPLIAFGLPLSPVAIGPGIALFNAPPVFTTEPLINNLHNLMVAGDYIVYGFIGLVGGAILAYPIAIKKARKWTKFILSKISHEALIGGFIGLIVMLAFYEAGILGIIIALSVAFFGGILHNLFGIHTGVQFMAFYASSFILNLFV